MTCQDFGLNSHDILKINFRSLLNKSFEVEFLISKSNAIQSSDLCVEWT